MNVVVVARAPEPGRCKTRMIPLLGAEGAAELQAALTAVTLEQVPRTTRVATSGDGVDARGLTTFAQEGAGFGDRLLHAVCTVGFPACLVGTDLPSLRNADFAAAEHLLAAHGVDVVFGPASDGGWWLGAFDDERAARAALGIEEDLWGGALALRTCTEAAAAAGFGVVHLGDPRLDLDEPDDARAALADRRLPAPIRDVLERRSKG